jgi:hypothetical protein
LALYSLIRWDEEKLAKWFYLSAIFAGIGASGKHTAWGVPLILGGIVAWGLLTHEKNWKSAFVKIFQYYSVSFLAGCLPLVRNFIWTGDPFFPFFANYLGRGNFYRQGWDDEWARALSTSHNVMFPDVLLFPFRFILEGANFNGGHLFGPIILSFTPLILIVILKGDYKRKILGAFCALFFIYMTFMAQTATYFTPIFPAALVMAIAGMWQTRKFKPIYSICIFVVGVYIFFGAGTNIVYSGSYVPVMLGMESRDKFLSRKATQYNISKFVNKNVDKGNVMVFYPHYYYLDVGYIQGEPSRSWASIRYPKIKSPEELKKVLKKLKVRYILKNDKYPERVANLYASLEKCCLEKVASRSINNLISRRKLLYGKSLLTLFRLKE